MPTYLVKDTYAIITLAEAAIPADLNGTGIHEIIVEASTYSESVTISGHSNASATDYIVVKAKSGDEHKGVFDSKIIVTGGIDVDTSYTRISDLQFGSQVRIDGTDIISKNILAKSDSNFLFRANNGANIKFECCIAWAPAASNAYGFYNQWPGTGQNVQCYNCLSHGFSYGFRYVGVTNCVVLESRSLDAFSANTNGDYNASWDTTAPGANSIHNLTAGQAAFKNKDNGDFHIKFNSSLKAAGTPQTSLFTQDIDLEGIEQWPIGPDYPVPTCWTYTARYKNSKRLYRVGGPEAFPKKLRVPSNVDISLGQMIDEGELIDPGKYIIQQ